VKIFSGVKKKIDVFRARYLPPGSLRHSLLSGGAWIISCTAVSRLSNLIMSIVIARLISKAEFGKWGVIFTAMMMFANIASFGMSSISARYVAMLKTTDTVRLGRILSFSLIFSSFSIVVMSGLCFILSGVISNSLYKSPDLQSTLAFASLNLLFWISNDCLQGILLGFEDFKRVSIIEVVKSLLFFGAAIPLSVVFRINGIVFAQIISLIVSFIFYLVFFGSLLRKYQIKLAFKNSLQAKKIIWDFGLPNLLSTLLTGPVEGDCFIYTRKYQENNVPDSCPPAC
jgi:O-antigen/teichoic acid export membrane protein